MLVISGRLMAKALCHVLSSRSRTVVVVWRGTVSCWAHTAVRERCCHEGAYLYNSNSDCVGDAWNQMYHSRSIYCDKWSLSSTSPVSGLMFGWWVYTHTGYIIYIFTHKICCHRNTEVSVYYLICVCLSVVYSGCSYESQWRYCRHQPYMVKALPLSIRLFVVFVVIDITFVVFGGWEIKPQKSRHRCSNHLQNVLKLVVKRSNVMCLLVWLQKMQTISTQITQPLVNV